MGKLSSPVHSKSRSPSLSKSPQLIALLLTRASAGVDNSVKDDRAKDEGVKLKIIPAKMMARFGFKKFMMFCLSIF
jgi:hypothetical protein